MTELRRAYFGRAAEPAARYCVSFDDMLLHLWRCRGFDPRFCLRNVKHVEDLVHVVACTKGVAAAWRDLSGQYERALVRRARHWLEEREAIVFVRRLFTEMRRGSGRATPSLAQYHGHRPLQRWLGDRAVGCLSRRGVCAERGKPGRRLLARRSRASINDQWDGIGLDCLPGSPVAGRVVHLPFSLPPQVPGDSAR